MNLKFLILFIIALMSVRSHAHQVKVYRHCSSEVLLNESIQLASTTVGDLTIESFERAGLIFQGTKEGINQIENSPIGMDALEIISDTEMKAYGWCFSVNGKVPESFAHHISLKETDNSVVIWFFGYAHYLDGKWVAQCVPCSNF